MLSDFLFDGFNFLFKLVLLPLFIVVAIGVFIIPFVPIVWFMQPSLESLFIALVLVGLWPMCMAVSYSAFFIGHFIGRSLPTGAEERYNLYSGSSLMYVRLAVQAGDFLSNALDDYEEALDTRTRQRGKKLVDHHRVLARFVWPGMAISVISGVGFALIQFLEIPSGFAPETP